MTLSDPTAQPVTGRKSRFAAWASVSVTWARAAQTPVQTWDRERCCLAGRFDSCQAHGPQSPVVEDLALRRERAIIGFVRFREWLGVRERRWKKAPDEEVQPAKTLWDWLQLLIVPVILVGVTFAWSALQTRSDNKREDRRLAADRATTAEARQDARLQSYLDDMSDLILKNSLLDSKSGDPVRAVARIDTLTVLHRLNGERKGQVVRFLYEARLIDSEAPGGGADSPAMNTPPPASVSTAPTLRVPSWRQPASMAPTSMALTSGAPTSSEPTLGTPT